ncbi:glycerone kinase [Amylolactobacillus amylotrophicus DSM 20534]|uniref:Glycerone kinase n=3 Tax=Amylolactobacillus TaxID=2767876 RepID=A0A0R1YLF8_9LACO|nr:MULTISPECIES: DAK2 domain-containing protein [Amylolactobacillus]APT17919.1 hypothetical protein LA20533_00650 [Amylolactobacillus amylophilus DSM 20533 = JCM 1125]KRK38371.1 glycerone kinase [Amylolactobacillus amylotrophicus DSM 20534]KRM42986.1 glycerone kinase [Amylolactobacillus amylophilus DSM 20533 = JCM 1125]GED79855.1 dihydroxyacetone kinase [Amylolactobacillus amylophilus]
MVLKEIKADKFRDMIRVASHRLGKNAQFVNSLNVFPVPDGDTGTNMNLTVQSGAKAVNEQAETDIGILTKALAKGMLMGARGNSGVITSQLFRGFQKSTDGKAVLTANDLAEAFATGVETAYKAVMKPVEGTILTVARGGAQAGLNAVKETDDAIQVMQAVADGAKKALKTTPDFLPVLKEVGVVDSGGQGLVFIYEGFFEGLSGEDLPDTYEPNESEMDEMVNAAHHQSVQSQLATEDIKFGYCTEIMVDLTKDVPNKKKFVYDDFRNYLDKLGDSLLVVSDDEVVKVHVHTENPGKVFAYGTEFGQLDKIKIDNMRIQHETIVEQDSDEEDVDFAVIAVASGDGIKDLFKSLGVNRIISGGQTMNPSTQDILDAVKNSGAKKALILPNNGNILMAAKQAAAVADIPVGIVPTKTISQGMTVMLSFNPDGDVDDNVAEMTEAIETVKSGEITKAIRKTEIDGVKIQKNDYMGIVDGDIKVAQTDLIETTVATIKSMLDDDSEIVTLLYGADTTEALANQVVEDLNGTVDDDIEFEIHAGGQPVYNFLISVE